MADEVVTTPAAAAPAASTPAATTPVAATTAPAAAPAATTPAAAPAASTPSIDKSESSLLTTPVDPAAATLIMGRYKTQEEQMKAHETLLAEWSKRGPTATVPESYDTKGLEEGAGIQFTDAAQREAVTGVFKEAGLSNDQVTKLAPAAKALAETNFNLGKHAGIDELVKKEFGSIPDRNTEFAKIQQAWGDQTEPNRNMVREYMQRHPEMFLPRHWTAAGSEELLQLARNELGPNWIAESGPQTSQSAQSRLSALTRDPDYRSNSPKGEALRAEAARMSQQISEK